MNKVTSAVIHPWHCDAQGHLNTRHLVGILDDANIVLLNSLAREDQGASANLGWADVRNELDYLAETKAMNVVDVFAAVRRIGTKSLTIALEMRVANSPDTAARMLAIITRFDLAARRAVALSHSIVNAAQAWLDPEAAGAPIAP